MLFFFFPQRINQESTRCFSLEKLKLRSASAMLVSNPIGIFDIFVLTAPLLGFHYAFFFLVHVLYSKLDLCLLLALSILQSKI